MKEIMVSNGFQAYGKRMYESVFWGLLLLLFGYGAQSYAQESKCAAPTNLVISSVKPNSVVISWKNPGEHPMYGYEYYLLTTGAPQRISGTTEIGVESVEVTGLTPSTEYMVFIKGICGAENYSDVLTLKDDQGNVVHFKTPCDSYAISSTTQATFCKSDSVTLGATASGGTVVWYAGQTGEAILGTGTTFTTPEISKTTSYWVATKYAIDPVAMVTMAPKDLEGTPKNENLNIPAAMYVLKETRLLSVDIYPLQAGLKGGFRIKNASGKVIVTKPFTTTVSGGKTAQTIELDAVLLPGKYTLIPETFNRNGRVTNTASRFSFSSHLARLGEVANVANVTSRHPGIYNWKFEDYCESSRTEVVATLTPLAAPTGETEQTITANTAAGATPGKIKVTGEGILWYASEENALNNVNPLSADMPLESGATYYAMQTEDGCRSVAPLAVKIVAIKIQCAAPTNLVVSSVTSDAAVISWTAPENLPENGYQYYVRAGWGEMISGTLAPDAVSHTITGLRPATSYMVFLRADCGNEKLSNIVNSGTDDLITTCDSFTITGTTPATFCKNNTATLEATASGGTIVWYAAQNGTAALGTGTTFNTPIISETTSYWVAAKKTFEPEVVGLVAPNEQESDIETAKLDIAVLFKVFKETKLLSVDIYPVKKGVKGTIVIKNASGKIIEAHRFTTDVSGGKTVQTIALNAVLPSGDYELIPGLLDEEGEVTRDVQLGFPFRTHLVHLVGIKSPKKRYPGLYNWKFEDYCISPRTKVVATLTSLPDTPTGNAEQTITTSTAAEATLEKIKVTGETIEWYASEDDALNNVNPLAADTLLKNEATYYAMQVDGNCRSETPLAVKVKTTLGTTTFDRDRLQYYPNPVTTVFNVTYSDSIDSVAVFNLVGQRVMDSRPNATSVRMDMSALPSGAYIVQLKAKGQSQLIKVIKK